MKRISALSSVLPALAAAVTTLAACSDSGSGGSPAEPVAVAAPPAASDDDGADAITRAQVDALIDPIDAQVKARGLPPLRQVDPASIEPTARGDHLSFDVFPGVRQTNLVANKPEFGAQTIEPLLKNPWGIAIRPAGFGGHFWVAAAGTGTSIQYVGDVGGTPLFQDALKVIDTGGPATGVAFNPGTNFTITQGHTNGPITAPTKFFFANLTGTITAWTERARAGGGFDHPADSVVVVDGAARGALFFGVAVSPAADRLYAADFGPQAAVRIYDAAFTEIGALANPFQPAGVKPPGGFEAFNVQTIGNSVFAMYGRHVPPDPSAPRSPEGRLAEFDADGRLVARWKGRGFLNYPWGVAMAPEGFGLYSGCLLVGNFGDGTIVAFHPRYKVALDYVRDARGRRVVLDGLWGLQFGNGASLGEANHVYFAAGPNREQDGLFGKLQPNPKTLPVLGDLSICRQS